MRIKVTDGDKEQVIQDILEIEEFFGEPHPLYDFCGLLGLCQECKKSGQRPCGKRYLCAILKRSLKELWVETSGKDYNFIGDNVSYAGFFKSAWF